MSAEEKDRLFPPGRTDADGEPVDFRPETSWTARIGEVPLLEALEVQLVNVLAPFQLVNGLTRPLLSAARTREEPGTNRRWY